MSNNQLSGLSGLELVQFAYDSFLKLKKSIVYGESKEAEGALEGFDSFEHQDDTMLYLLGLKLEGPQYDLNSYDNY